MDNSDQSQREKWDRNYRGSSVDFPRPCRVLDDYGYLLPASGKALDIACGLGGNALLLAAAGLNTTAIDISEVAIDKLQGYAERANLDVHGVVASVSDYYFASVESYQGNFDVITVANYLDRSLFGIIADLLAPGGLLFYQTFVREKSNLDSGPQNPEYLLNTNELLSLTAPLVCRVFLDLGSVGETDSGLRDQSCIVVQKV